MRRTVVTRLRPAAARRRSPTARARGPGLLLALALVVSGCATFARHATYQRTASPAMRGAWMEYALVVPDDFSGAEHLPVVIFLHGGGDGPDCFDRAGLGVSIAAAMTRGELPRAVIVIPEGDLGFWANWYDGSRRYEDWVLDDLLPRVARRHHTLACPEGCHVMGVSMGAEGALRFAMHRPELFATVTSISGPALDTDRRIAFVEDRLWQTLVPTYHVFGPTAPRSRVEADDPFLRWTSPEALGSMRLLLAWGDADRGEVREGSEALHEHLLRHGVPHTSVVYSGTHSWASWGPVIMDALRTQVDGAAHE